MLSREKINSGATYYILDASQHERIKDFISVGGFNLISESWDICMLLGGFGGMLPRENFKKWCVLEYILLQFCQKNLQKCLFCIQKF